ncbi:tetratricopeptide repeat protein 14-like isoform X2 [Ornithodoros turicata]
MESHLLKGALVSYGQELLSALKEEQGLGYALQGLSRSDLQQAHPRHRDQLLQDPAKRSKFIRFVARKADVLYKTWDTLPHTLTTDEENEELCAVMPPIESFMSVPAAERKKYFFETLKKGDIVVGHISGKQENGFFVTLLCMDGGLRREIHDLGIKAFCPLNQIQTFSAHESPFDIFQSKDLVRGVVISCSSELERIILSMKSDALPADQQHLMKLGLLTEEEIPSHHKRLLSTHGRSFQEVLERTMGFNNPATATHLCSVLGIPSWKQASLMKGMQMKEYPREEYAVALRKAQSSKWAYKSLKDGVMHFKAGNHTEAFVCLNKALQIDPENVEALVARGALFANNSNLRRALEDFEAALALNPNHPNARKYMSETLVALGRYYEEKGDLEGAVKTYKKAVKVNLSNADARDALMAVEVRDRKKDSDTHSLASQTSALADPQAGVSKPKDTREKLRMLLREDEKKKHKKHHRSRRSSSSSSASSSSSSGSSRSSSSSGYGRHRSHKHRSRKHHKGDGEAAEKHHGSKKKKSKEGKAKGSENGAPAPEPAPPGQPTDEEDSYWKMAGETRGGATGQAAAVQQPLAASSSGRQARRSMSPLSRALAQRLYEAEEELGVHKSAYAPQEETTRKSTPSPKVTFVNRLSESQQAPRLFHISGSDVAQGSAPYDRKEGGDGFRMESVVRRPEVAPPAERKSIEFKWKAVKKPLQQADAESHEEGSVTSDDEKKEPEKKEEKEGDDGKEASSHEEGSIRSESDREKDRKKRRDYSSSRSSSGGRKERPAEKHRRRIRRRADSESYSSSAHSKSPPPRRRRRRSGDRSEDYSSDRSSVSRGRRRRGRSSDSSRSRRRYSSEDSRDGKGRKRDDSYSSDSSHRRHSPSRRGRGGYRPYYHQNRGGYYNNRRYNNYRGGYQNNRYFRGGRGGRRPYRPYYNRGSPRYYNNSGGYSNRSRDSRDRRSGSEGHDDRGGSFCPPWKRKNPIVSRAPDAEELKKLKEAAAQRHQEKEEAGSSKITKATIIRNWLDDADSRSPPRGSVSPKASAPRAADVVPALPVQPPLPPISFRNQQPPPPGE